MAGSRRKKVPVESSWRLVEGENESFDTSLVPESDCAQDDFLNSQVSGSQPFSVGGSQDDNIENFLEADEDRVIMRTPFRPTVPQWARQTKHRAPNVPKPRESSSRAKHRQPLRKAAAPAPSTMMDRFTQALPVTVSDSLGWLMGLVGLAFGYAQKPLAIALSVYVSFGVMLVAQNVATRSISVAMSPICRLPGASLLHLPFCPEKTTAKDAGKPVEFDAVVTIQDRFEQVVETSVDGAQLPLDMKKSEMAIRDLRTMVRHSSLQGKEELLLELDGFVDAMRTGSSELLQFNSHVGFAVDSLISINRWTSRYLHGMAVEADTNGGSLASWTKWVLTPFRPPDQVLLQRLLLVSYMDHTARLSEKLARLIEEGMKVLRTLRGAEDHLGAMHDFVTRTEASTREHRNDVLWTLWTLTGANSRQLRKLGDELALLKRVEAQRSDAVRRVTELVVELEKIQADLGGLRDTAKTPSLVGDAVPLAVHVETINAGVERLEESRNRIRTAEAARLREASGLRPEIDGV